jgi:hypothetical protein
MLTKFFKKTQKLATLSLFSLATLSAHAKDFSGWYQIEMAIFNQQTYDTAVSEGYFDTEMFELTADSSELTQLFGDNNYEMSKPLVVQPPRGINGFQRTNTSLLNDEVRRLSNSKAYQLIWHKSWNQYLTRQSVSKTSTLHLKDANNRDALVAQFEIYVKRYLHADIKLAQIRYLDQPTPLPLKITNQVNAIDPQKMEAQTSISEIRSIEEKRRMRSNEIHYFDHPRLGILLKIRRIETETTE